jgi:hypothetical protein
MLKLFKFKPKIKKIIEIDEEVELSAELKLNIDLNNLLDKPEVQSAEVKFIKRF